MHTIYYVICVHVHVCPMKLYLNAHLLTRSNQVDSFAPKWWDGRWVFETSVHYVRAESFIARCKRWFHSVATISDVFAARIAWEKNNDRNMIFNYTLSNTKVNIQNL